MNPVPFPILYGLAGILAGRLLRAVIPLFCPDAAALRIPPEPLACLLFFLCCGVYGPGYYSLLSCAVCSLLLEAALVDSACFLIPDHVPALISLCAVFAGAAGLSPSPAGRLSGCLICGGTLLGLRLLTHGGIGLGDVKLMAACGLFLGPLRSLAALFGAYILAGLWFAPALLRRKANLKTRIPMAPFFCASLVILLLWGTHLLRWYMALSNIDIPAGL